MIIRCLTPLILLWVHVCHAAGVDRLRDQPEEWFGSEEGRAALSNVLSWQSPHGDWPKNRDTSKAPYQGSPSDLKGTFDNGATTGELKLLAMAFHLTGEKRYREAFLKGFDHILKAQYPNGGWPQYFPLSKNYHRHITFNDGTMIRLMEFLRESIEEETDLLDPERRQSAQAAFLKGIDCIVKCQIKLDGQPTVWCAQHDEITLEPAPARSYELPSLSGGESAGILRFLMSLPQPSQDVIAAVKAGVAWFASSAINGHSYDRREGLPILIPDENAPPLWARFYQIGSNKPFFCDRDGVMKFDLREISLERQRGYSWYGHWGQNVTKAYAAWPYR